MSKKFTRGTMLFVYECMMQSIPSIAETEREEERLKGKFYESLIDFMKCNCLKKIISRVTEASTGFIFDGILFKNEEHKSKFFMMYGSYVRLVGTKPDNMKIAIIYLLSANRFFYPFLETYICTPEKKLGEKIKGRVDEEVYNLYHAARRIVGQKSGLTKMDLKEEGIIDDRTVCIIINAMYLNDNGLMCGCDDYMKSAKSTQKNKSKSKSRTYTYKNQTVRIK